MVGARSRSSWFRLLGSGVTIVVLACGGGGGGGGPTTPPGGGGGTGGGGGGPGGGGGGATGDVTATPNAFQPLEFSVRAGNPVMWVNSSSDAHSVTSDTGAWPAGALPSRNSTFGRTFSTVGVFPYHCEFHGAPGVGMHGTIRVTQ